jgi:hypothetical protein
MSKAAARFRARPALELMEEAVRLLRAAPASALLAHFIGSAPCLLYAIYFFTDLSRSAFASEHVVGESLGLAVLYCWMKSWQAVSLAQLRATLLRQPPPRWDTARLLRLAAAQMLLQPLGLLLRFAASMVLLPYIWVAIFFQNVTVLGDGTAEVRGLCAAAWTETKRWPIQAHGIAWYLAMFGLFVYLNVASLMLLVPALLKSLLGIETVFSQHPQGMLEPTFFVTAFAFTYLFLDPIRKAAVALRCFYGRSIQSGEDLAVELKRARGSAPGLVAVLASLLLLCGVAPRAEAEPAGKSVEATELSRSIDDVLERREFTWRLPHEKAVPPGAEKLSSFEKSRREIVKWKARMTARASRAANRLWHKLLDWLFPKRGDSSKAKEPTDWWNAARVTLLLALIVTAGLLAVLVVRRWRRPVFTEATAEAAAAQPDLREENISADQLPEDGWLQLARELLDRGELRLALRASYLAGLAHLGGRELIRLAKHKSNRDYDRELRRRARAQNELLAAFERNLETFEGAWYGDHPVTPELLGDFSQNLERIRAC